jgi:hypothetical protein
MSIASRFAGEKHRSRQRTRARDPRIALSILDFNDPHREAQIRGRVVERRPDPDLKIMDPISKKYAGKPFPLRSPEGRLALVIEVEKARYTKLRSSTHRRHELAGEEHRHGWRRAILRSICKLTLCFEPASCCRR